MVGVCVATRTAQRHNTAKFQILNVGMLVPETRVDAVVQDGATLCTASLLGLLPTMWAVLSMMAAVTWRTDLGHMATQQQLVPRHAIHMTSLHCNTTAGVCAATPTAQRLNTVRWLTMNAETRVLVSQMDAVVVDGAMQCTNPCQPHHSWAVLWMMAVAI